MEGIGIQAAKIRQSLVDIFKPKNTNRLMIFNAERVVIKANIGRAVLQVGGTV